MTLEEIIRSAIKSNRAVIGYNESIKYIKSNQPKIIVTAKNLPISLRKEIENNLKLSKTKLEVFNGTSLELGVICGKPFPVSALVIQ